MTRDTDRNPQGEDRNGLRAQHESRGRQASPDLGRTNLTDRLGELVDKVTPAPVFAAAMNYIQHSAIDPKISGDDAFNRESKANAEFIALCFTHKDEILSALRKAEEPVPGDFEKAVMPCPQCEGEGGYPDGLDEAACHTECTRCAGNGWIVDVSNFPAATAIERLTADRDLWKQSEETCSRQHDLRAAEVERLTAREAELREALGHIAKGHSQTLGTGKVVNVPLRALDAQRIARLSLGDEK